MEPCDFATDLASAAIGWCDDDHELVLGLDNSEEEIAAGRAAPCYPIANEHEVADRDGARAAAIRALAPVIEAALRSERAAICLMLRDTARVARNKAASARLAGPLIEAAADDVEAGHHAVYRKGI